MHLKNVDHPDNLLEVEEATGALTQREVGIQKVLRAPNLQRKNKLKTSENGRTASRSSVCRAEETENQAEMFKFKHEHAKTKAKA